MKAIPKKYVTDEKGKTVAVQLDIKDFERMENIIEDHVLGKYMESINPELNFSLTEAKKYYNNQTQ